MPCPIHRMYRTSKTFCNYKCLSKLWVYSPYLLHIRSISYAYRRIARSPNPNQVV